MSAKVQVEDLRKRYGAIEAARGVSFEIMDGEIFGLLGPNGAGKTTTLECVIGLREPDSGSIRVCGIDARQNPREVKERIGAALQTTALQDKITPREALGLFGAFYRNSTPPEQLLQRFSLTEKADASFDSLSGGQRQRLALALAFVNRPDLLFLDEPTTGLDPQSRRELHAEIQRMRADGHTVLITTHYMAEAEELCDRVAIIDRGKVIASGRPGDLIAQSSALPMVALKTSTRIDPLAFAGITGIDGLTVSGQEARFRAAAAGKTLAAVLARVDSVGLDVLEVHMQKATLEDVFIELTGARLRD